MLWCILNYSLRLCMTHMLTVPWSGKLLLLLLIMSRWRFKLRETRRWAFFINHSTTIVIHIYIPRINTYIKLTIVILRSYYYILSFTQIYSVSVVIVIRSATYIYILFLLVVMGSTTHATATPRSNKRWRWWLKKDVLFVAWVDRTAIRG